MKPVEDVRTGSRLPPVPRDLCGRNESCAYCDPNSAYYQLRAVALELERENLELRERPKASEAGERIG